jgi:ribosomal protein S18 acetylase RimI-like enzyme
MIIWSDDADGGVEVAPLRPEHVPLLNASGNPRLDETDIEAILRRSPGGSFWAPETGEFILTQPWRARPELPYIHTLWSFDHDRDRALLDAAVSAASDTGAACLLMLETGERRKPSFYDRHGFERIEVIRTYEHLDPEQLGRLHEPCDVRFSRISRGQEALLAAAEEIDHAAFPWFWHNSHDEFVSYISFPGVEMWAAERDGRVVSYFGITQFHRWAHLDRIAVAPDMQRSGLGKVTLGFAAHRMVEGGADRIGLSTQSNNRVSQRMYESLGFRHTRQSDYDVYGLVFDPGRVYDRRG